MKWSIEPHSKQDSTLDLEELDCLPQRTFGRSWIFVFLEESSQFQDLGQKD